MSMIQVEHLSFCYDRGIEPVFEDVSFVVDTDWKSRIVAMSFCEPRS